MANPSRQDLERVADHFRALGDPTRLQIVRALQQREHSVGELAAVCGCTSANISRHLALLCRHGVVTRTVRGTSAWHSIADDTVHALCELVCASIGRRQHDTRAGAPFIRNINQGEKS